MLKMAVTVMYLFIGFLYFGLVKSDPYIYHLSESEYAQLPPKFHLDPYEECLHDGGVYCTVKFHLVTDQPNKLYDIIKQYSAHKWTHYNHTLPQYGICLSRTCKDFYKQNVTADTSEILEACLNESMWEKYELKARVLHDVKCERLNEGIEWHSTWDTPDTIVSVLIALLSMMNLVGSLHEFYYFKTSKRGQSVLNCFWIRHNWKKMTSPAGLGPEPRLTRLKGFNGFRAVLTSLVLMCHSLIPFVHNVENPQIIEEGFYRPLVVLLLNGSLIIQIFFVISGFLLSYNMQLYGENHRITWRVFPVGILKRWLRLVPVYAMVLAVTATLLKYAKSGPLWQSMMTDEINDCRRDWWLHLLFINNFTNFWQNSYCMLHSWYVATDFQLHIVGLIVCVFVRERHRMKFLAALFITGVVTSAAHTYFQDLDPDLVFSPESTRDFYILDSTFNLTYKQSHTNLCSYTIGLALGILVYRWQKTDYHFNKYLRHRVITWLLIPALIMVVKWKSLFYVDRPPISLFERTLVGALIKAVFGGISAIGITSLVFRFENKLRPMFEAEMWTVPARVSYSIFIVHFVIMKLLFSTRKSLPYASAFHFCMTITTMLMLSFLAAILLHLLVDMPCQNLIKLLSSRHDEEKHKMSNGKADSKKES